MQRSEAGNYAILPVWQKLHGRLLDQESVMAGALEGTDTSQLFPVTSGSSVRVPAGGLDPNMDLSSLFITDYLSHLDIPDSHDYSPSRCSGVSFPSCNRSTDTNELPPQIEKNGYLIMDAQRIRMDSNKSDWSFNHNLPNFDFQGVQMLPPREILEARAQMIEKKRLREMALMTGKHFMEAIEKDFEHKDKLQLQQQQLQLVQQHQLRVQELKQGNPASQPIKPSHQRQLSPAALKEFQRAHDLFMARQTPQPTLAVTPGVGGETGRHDRLKSGDRTKRRRQQR